MRIFPPELQIGDLEGFSAEKDIFGRKHLGTGLANLLGALTDSTVIAIDAPWGAGKTVFLKMLAGHLRLDGFPVVYFDAYRNDYAEDAFTAISAEIFALVEEKKKAKTPAGKAFLKRATGAGKVLLRSGLRLGVKVATLNALDSQDFEDSAAAIADELSTLTDQQVGHLLTQQRNDIAAVKAFQDALSKLPGLLCDTAMLTESAGARPLILFIDELDRCRPIYALEVLERMKHFFSVPNVHFVLGTNLRQLRNSVVAAYGVGIDANTYLQKFIHLNVPLVDEGVHEHERVITKYIQYLRNALYFKTEDFQDLEYTSQFIKSVAENKGLSLRSVERIMTNLAIALAFTKSNTFRVAPILGGLCVMKVLEPELYEKAKAGTLVYAEVAPVLGLTASPGLTLQEDEFDVRWWRYCTDPTLSQDDKRSMNDVVYRYSLGSASMVSFVANNVLDRFVAT